MSSHLRALLALNRVPAASTSPRVLPFDSTGVTDLAGLHVEHLSIETELGEHCPIYLVREESQTAAALRPVIYMHGTNSSKHALLQAGHLQQSVFWDPRAGESGWGR